MPRWTTPEASLTVTEDVVFAELPDDEGRHLTHAIPPRTFLGGMWQPTLVAWLGPVAIAEARAWLLERDRMTPDRVRPPLRGRLGERPAVVRSGGTTRTGWTIRGRVVEVFDPSWRRTFALDAVAAAGLPPDHPLPAAVEAELLEAVMTLARFGCACGTGVVTPAEHGTIDMIVELREGERAASVGRCERCGRAWSFDGAQPATRATFDGVW